MGPLLLIGLAVLATAQPLVSVGLGLMTIALLASRES
jgi:hypothetical protein